MMNKKAIVLVVALVVVVAGGLIYWYLAPQQHAPEAVPPPGAVASSTASSASGMIMPTSTGDATAAGSSAAPVTATAVSIANFSYNPATITVKKGATVTWTNNDAAPHTVTADGGSFASQTLQPGEAYRHTFTVAGTFTYHCAIHPYMHGTVIVQ